MANFARTVKKHRTRLSGILAVVFLFFAGPTSRSLLLGLPVIFLGEAIRIWSSGHIHKSMILTVTGPYSLSRNPLYVGSFLLGTGFVIAMDDLRLAVVFFLFFGFVYWFTIQWEEKKLARRFPGQWEDYFNHVPRFFPVLKMPEYKAGQFSWAQVWKNREPANSCAVLVVYIILWVKVLFLGG